MAGKNPRALGVGRKKGTPNKKTELLADKCKSLGVDPFEILLLFAKGDWESLGYKDRQCVRSIGDAGIVYEDVISSDLRAKCAKDACEYLHPKRKSVEHALDPDDVGFRVIVEDFLTGK